MIVQSKFNTPERDYSEAALLEARLVFLKCQGDVEHDKWNNTGFSRDYRGYLTSVTYGEYFSAMGLLFKNFVFSANRDFADEVLEIIIAVIGSESNKMGFTSPRSVEENLLKKGVSTLFNRCENACIGIIVDNRTERNVAYIVESEKSQDTLEGNEESTSSIIEAIEPYETPVTTKSGKLLTKEDIEELADEAEKGYDIEELQEINRDSYARVNREGHTEFWEEEVAISDEAPNLHKDNTGVQQRNEVTPKSNSESAIPNARRPARKLSPRTDISEDE